MAPTVTSGRDPRAEPLVLARRTQTVVQTGPSSRSAVRDRSPGHVRLRRRVPAGLAPPGRCGPARRSLPLGGRCLPGGTGEVGGDDVGGVPVETSAGSVVADGGPWIGVRG